MAGVLIWVQHLLGVGHLSRVAALAAGLRDAGQPVTLASGGPPAPHLLPPGVEVYSLPWLKAADSAFSGLVDADGRAPGPDLWQARATALEAALAARDPEVVVTEMYPFGRNAFRAEVEGLLAAARARPRPPAVVCSVRDVLVRRSPARTARMAEAAAAFDRILIHGDPAVLPFAETFPPWPRIADRAVHTGYLVGPTPPAPAPQGRDAVIVSVGGGAVGDALVSAALAARPLSRMAGDAPWRVLVGHGTDDRALTALQARAAPGTVVERARADFRALLAGARASVSQCGYNTAAEVLAAGCPAVFVPFATTTETEQSDRAARLAARGHARVVPPESLDPAALAAAIDAALPRPPAGPASASPPVNLGGIARSVAEIAALAADRRGAP